MTLQQHASSSYYLRKLEVSYIGHKPYLYRPSVRPSSHIRHFETCCKAAPRQSREQSKNLVPKPTEAKTNWEWSNRWIPCVVLIATLYIGLPVNAGEISSNASFTKNCAGCHAGGGNIVQRGAGLDLADLQKNKAASPEEIYKLIYFGKGKMPGYGKDCTPKGKCTFAARLPDEEIEQLTSYVLAKANTGWAQ